MMMIYHGGVAAVAVAANGWALHDWFALFFRSVFDVLLVFVSRQVSFLSLVVW